MAGGSVLQIGIAPLLIFGLFGFPDLGVAGAAWAYVASRIFSVALYLVILLRVRMISWSLTDLGKSWWAILHVGGPATLSSLTFPISMLVITRLLAGHGDEVVAGYAVASRVETLVHMVIWSASSSVAPFVGPSIVRQRDAQWSEVLTTAEIAQYVGAPTQLLNRLDELS